MTALSIAIEPSALSAAAALLENAGVRAGSRASSKRRARLASLYAAAEETLGRPEKAVVWLTRPNLALGGETPVALSATEQGSRQVETLLGQIAHGLAA